MDEVVEKAIKDKKTVQYLIELLSDENPGTVGDSLFVLMTVLRESPTSINITPELVEKVLSLLFSKNPYVREGAMGLSMEIASKEGEKFKNEFKRVVERMISEGDKNLVAFALLIIKELRLSEFKDKISEFVEVEDKVILPFKGRKWVKIGDIAKEVLEIL
ncbi:hypothetical protein Py04_1268 [Pyrococcus sp. ST04]|nr:hypothetical protein Py04_1268 [Pyrococcus sp. ST04]